MFETLDAQKVLTRNQKKLIFAGAFGVILEFLDYFLIAFILTIVAKPWGLNVGKSSIILSSSGVGAIIGALYFGWLADRIGRRSVFMTTLAIFTLGTAALVFTPDAPATGWIYLAVMRFIIGLGAGGLYCVDLPLVQEFMPSRLRGPISGMITAAVPAGFLAGSALIAFVYPVIGWRGVMALCVLFSVLTLLMRTWIPESPRWLVQNGRPLEGRRSVAWALQVSPESLPAAAAAPVQQRRKFSELFNYPRSMAVSWITNVGTQTGYYGLALWTPTLIVQFLGVTPKEAALYMVFISLSALAGRFVVSYLSERIGRRHTGMLACGAAVLALAGAAYAGVFLGHTAGSNGVTGASFFLACVAIAFFFGEGVFAVVGPYSAEVWPSSLRTTGMGAAYGIGGIGKIFGPLGLALIVGTSTSAGPAASGISPQTACLYFAVWYVLAGLAFLLFAFETRGRSIESLDQSLADRSAIDIPCADRDLA